MPVANPQKTLNVSSMRCGDIATITMSFKSAASLALKPADIVLIMDRSGSMTEDKMTSAKAAAKQFIDLVDGARDGATRMGLVSYSDTATADVALTGNFTDMKPAVDALKRGGLTNHKVAFEEAEKLLSIPTSVRQVIVIFTDGESSVNGDPASVVRSLKDKGVEIFCIGLATNPAPLNSWASDPDSTHVAYTDDSSQLNRVFSKIASEVILAGARDVVIREQLMPDFKIVKTPVPDEGTVTVTGPQSLIWTLDAAGLSEQPTSSSLSFDIMYTGSKSGTIPVNESVVYQDREGNTLDFPSPTVEADCSGTVIYPEPCPNPTDFSLESCQDAARVTLDETFMKSLGRIVQLDVTVKSVCPGKRVAVSVILTEIAPDGSELPRGIKHILAPALTGDSCQDLTLKCIQFSLPEELNAEGKSDSICSARRFGARVIADYVDTDFICCDKVSEIL